MTSVPGCRHLSDESVAIIEASLEASRALTRQLALDIHGRPESALEEVYATGLMTEALAKAGFDVAPVEQTPTAFVATLDSGRPGPRIAILAEYDALPGVGHGCGHNLVAGAALHAGLGLREALPELGGSVQVIGCPAEETLEGKDRLISAGAFDDTTAALIYHPHSQSTVMSSCTGVCKLRFTFAGLAAHAADDPWNGVSALDGVLQTFIGVSALRQFLRNGSRIHGIITDGGSAVNVIPETAECIIQMRSFDPDELVALQSKVTKCAEGAALATGSTVQVEQMALTKPVRLSSALDPVLVELISHETGSVRHWETSASTDFGTVSHLVPAALISIASWPEGVAFHSREAAEYAGKDLALDAMLTGGRVMAFAAAELLTAPEAVQADLEDMTQRT